jgi:hypothetical protein
MIVIYTKILYIYNYIYIFNYIHIFNGDAITG